MGSDYSTAMKPIQPLHSFITEVHVYRKHAYIALKIELINQVNKSS